MAKNISVQKKTVSTLKTKVQNTPFTNWLDQVLTWGIGLLCLFISICFYLGTYDTAFVKITLLQTGGIVLLTFWAALLAVQKRGPVAKQNLPWILPFLIYFGWNFLITLFAPYPLDAFDEILRYVLYFGLSLLILDRFTQNSARILTKCIILAAWISCVYGLLQVVDRWLPGADIMPWRGYFGTRIFSTHANPNFFADFLVFSSCLIFAEYMRLKQKRLLVLLAIILIDLFFSECKGAWLGFAASGALITALYTNCSARIKPYAKRLNMAAAVLLIGAGLLVGVYAAKRFQSVSFRTYTWAAVFDMVQDSPVLGTGIGSFKTIYPAYRKPQIFYIEKMHNNETQHAENEYLEQWATAGTVGLALFLYFIFFVLYTGWRGLKRREGIWDDSAWMTVGYMAAFFGICVHGLFDVSIRFVSTGLFFALFAALTVRLNMPDFWVIKEEPAPAKKGWLWLMRIVLAAAVIWLVYYFIYLFSQTALDMEKNSFGNGLVTIISWGVFCGLTLLGTGVYLRAAWFAKWVRVPLVLLLSIWPLQLVCGLFTAEHYFGLATGFALRNNVDGALDFYQKAIALNPFHMPLRQYRAYILRNTMDLQRSYSPLKGDVPLRPGQQPLTDYERVVRDLALVKQHAPNNALLYHAYGEFYYMYAKYFTQLSLNDPLDYRRAEYAKKAVENMELAKKSFQRFLLLDPVYDSTYVYMTDIAMMERNPDEAQRWIDAYRRGPQGVIEKEFLQTHEHNARLEYMEQRLRQPPFIYWWKNPPEKSLKE